MKNKYVIVRSNLAGVFFGKLENQDNGTITLLNARKIYYWTGAYTVEDIADKGVAEDSKITVSINKIIILGADQINQCTDKAVKVLKSIPVWKY